MHYFYFSNCNIDEYKNLQLLHKHCHIEKSRIDGSRGKKTNIQLGQEPDEVKVSRPVRGRVSGKVPGRRTPGNSPGIYPTLGITDDELQAVVERLNL